MNYDLIKTFTIFDLKKEIQN